MELRSSSAGHDFASETALMLANEVVESYNAIRKYLVEVNTCLECVDPHLCKNVGLVARLSDLEESWEFGSLYVQRKPTLFALCHWVSQIKEAQALSPEFETMCGNCDVEMFMILPRIILLCYLLSPIEQGEIMSSVMPQRIGRKADHDLSLFVRNSKMVFGKLSGQSGEGAMWKSLLLQAVVGPTSTNSETTL